jgi:hypothetical protein
MEWMGPVKAAQVLCTVGSNAQQVAQVAWYSSEDVDFGLDKDANITCICTVYLYTSVIRILIYVYKACVMYT